MYTYEESKLLQMKINKKILWIGLLLLSIVLLGIDTTNLHYSKNVLIASIAGLACAFLAHKTYKYQQTLGIILFLGIHMSFELPCVLGLIEHTHSHEHVHSTSIVGISAHSVCLLCDTLLLLKMSKSVLYFFITIIGVIILGSNLHQILPVSWIENTKSFATAGALYCVGFHFISESRECYKYYIKTHKPVT